MNFFNKERKDFKAESLVYAPKDKDIAITSSTILTEALKGMVESNKVRFPADLGQEHPFSFKKMEDITKKYGIVSAIIDKHIDFMMSGGLNIKSETSAGQTIIEMFMKDFGFDSLMRNWLREAFIKGNGFMELTYDKNGAIVGTKILDAEYMYVVRDEFGNVKGYNQYVKPLKEIKSFDKEDVIPFKVKEIAHLSFNQYGDSPYGSGIVWPLVTNLYALEKSRDDLHLIMKRKANNPFVFYVGDRTAKDYPKSDEVSALGEKFEHLTNKHEWVFSDYVRGSVLDTGNPGDKFSFVIDDDTEKLFEAAQIPSVIMGKANVSEGLAKVQMRAWELRVTSLREETEKIVEEKIFKPVMISNGSDEHTEVIWGLPSQEEKNNKSKIIIDALKNPFLGEGLREQLQLQLGELFDVPPEEVETPEQERAREEEKEKQPIVPEERQTKPVVNPRSPEKQKAKESYTPEQLEAFNNMPVQEWVGFNFLQYKDYVLDAANVDEFVLLKAKTKTEVAGGLLKQSEIEKLRTTMYDAFNQDLTIKEIEKNINKRIDLKDRYRMKDGKFVLNKDGKRVISKFKESRAIAIARTETVRIANLGSILNYKANKITKVRWIAAASDRTCPECMDLDGQIFPIDSGVAPPLHGMCRCTLSPVVDL